MRTKILMLMIGLFVSIINITNAQVGDQTSIGPRVGINFSNVNNVDGSESLTGLVLGLTSTYSISEESGITVDLLYSQEGFELGASEYRLNYLNLPVYFDLFFGELGQKFRPKIYAGIVPGLLIDAKIDDAEFDELYNSFNISLSGGGGFNLRVGNRIWLNTDLRAYLGLSEIRENPVGDKVSNSNIQLSVGLAYGLAKY